MSSLLPRLRELNRRFAARLVQLDATPRRDPTTGAYTARGTIDGKTLRKVWSMNPPQPKPAEDDKPGAPLSGRAALKRSLVTAIRARK